MGPSSGRHQVNRRVLGQSRLPTLIQLVPVLEVFISSKAWFFAQVIPLPAAAAASLNRILGDFVWAHSLARLAFPQLHRPFSQGGLGLCNQAMRAQSLLVKQVLHQLAAGDRPALFSPTDGASPPWKDFPAGGDHPTHWPASTTVCGPPRSPAGGCEARQRECGFPGGHQVIQHLQGLDGGPASPPHSASAPGAPLGPRLEEAVGSLPATGGCCPPFPGPTQHPSHHGEVSQIWRFPFPSLSSLPYPGRGQPPFLHILSQGGWSLGQHPPQGHSAVWPRPHQQVPLLPGLVSEASEDGGRPHPGSYHLLSLGVGDKGPRGHPPTSRLSSQNCPGCC